VWRRLAIVVAMLMLVLALGAAALPASGNLGAASFGPSQLYGGNFPDPHVIFNPADGLYYAYSTNTGGARLPAMRSPDLQVWFTREAWSPNVWNGDPEFNDALVRAPAWAAPTSGGNEVWAPSVHRLPSGEWLAYYTIRERNGAQPRYCISAATAPGPWGPFEDRSAAPLTCGYGPAGAIDPWLHVDSANRLWLVWKVENHGTVEIADDDVHFPLTEEEIDERAQRELAKSEQEPLEPRKLAPSRDAIWAQRLDDTGRAFWQPDDPEEERSTATVLLTADASGWEGGIVESPALFTIDGELRLLYSGNRWGSPDYATGWARCSAPDAPCTRAAGGPILVSDETDNGPGGASVFVDRFGDHRVAYHAWNAPFASYPAGQRFLRVDVLCRLPGGALSIGLPPQWDFCDTDPTQWFGPGIAWMAATGITTGITPARFAPSRPLTRAEAVTFLWRWAGSPPPANASSFLDVEVGRYYSDAVAWAREKEIVKGTTVFTFSPDDLITRAQIATILHRAAAQPAPRAPAAFTDVETDRFYSDAVAWLAEAGITTGLTPTTFGPDDPATRAQFATMLCRNSATEPGEAVTAAVAACRPD
jgi:Glycosyl hydrolases family 43/S-layer homology domain